MYADDTNVTFSASSLADRETQINSELKHIDPRLKAIKINLNVAKTEFLIISSRQKSVQSLNDYAININVDGVQINQTSHCKSLVLNID